MSLDMTVDDKEIRHLCDLFRSKPYFLTYEDPSKQSKEVVEFLLTLKERFVNAYGGMLYCEQLMEDGYFNNIAKDKSGNVVPVEASAEYDTDKGFIQIN